MNWSNFFIGLLIPANIAGFVVLFYQTVDYLTWDYKSEHTVQRNWVIAGFAIFSIEIAIFAGLA